MKILSIGNSFSQDAHKWLHKLAAAQSLQIETVNLYIGGCSLQTHWSNALQDNAFYDLERNGNLPERKISISEALSMETWDIITLQQVSQLSGLPESYEPYFQNLLNVVKQYQPAAQIWFHQTWAYEIDSVHSGFGNYDCDQQKMYACIVSATDALAKCYHLPVIPSGRVIQTLRENVPDFDYLHSGRSLCRDGFHMSFDYGRFAVAATWMVALTGKRIHTVEFEDFDPVLLSRIADTVNQVLDCL